VQDDFSGHGLEARVSEGVVQVAGGDNSFGLLNLAQICKQIPPDDWVDAIASHFEIIRHNDGERNQLEAEVDDFARVRDRLGLRIYPEDFLDNEMSEGAIIYRDLPGTVTVLVIDLPTSVATVPKGQMATWGLDERALREQAQANLARLAVCEEESVELGAECRATVLLGDSLFTATWALQLEQRLPTCAEAHGALVGLPHRHALIVHPITGSPVLTAINTMIPMISGMYQEGPGSISPRLYWYHAGVFTELPYDIGEQEIQFTPPAAFLSMIEGLLE
jgi:hypothetical protein